MNENAIEQTFGKLGKNYQIKLLAEILEPNNINLKTKNLFFNEVIHTLSPNYFEKELRQIAVLIKDYFNEYNIPPNIDNIVSIVNTKITNEIDKNELLTSLRTIYKIFPKRKSGEINNDTQAIKDSCLDFIKQREFAKIVTLANLKLEKGEIDNVVFHEIDTMFRDVRNIGKQKSNSVEIFEDIDSVLVENAIQPVFSGIPFIDKALPYGIGVRGGITTFVLSQGKGKTSILSYVASELYLKGDNVLHIILESRILDVRQKHYAKLTGIGISSLHKESHNVKSIINKIIKNRAVGNLNIVKLDDGSTLNDIKNCVKNTEEKTGKKVTTLVIDYLECVTSGKSKVFNEFQDQGQVIKDLDTWVTDENIFCLTAAQMKKELTQQTVVALDSIYGTALMGKKSCVVIGVGSTLAMDKENLCNFSICKHRYGGTGLLFENVHFDRNNLVITDDGVMQKVDNDLINKAENFEKSFDDDGEIISNKMKGVNINE